MTSDQSSAAYEFKKKKEVANDKMSSEHWI